MMMKIRVSKESKQNTIAASLVVTISGLVKGKKTEGCGFVHSRIEFASTILQWPDSTVRYLHLSVRCRT
jgi:hypothetical protein